MGMSFFAHDFKHTCIRLISFLIIGVGLLFLALQIKKIYGYVTDTVSILSVASIYAQIVYAIVEMILFMYHNLKKQSNIWDRLKLFLRVIFLSSMAYVIIIFSMFMTMGIEGYHG